MGIKRSWSVCKREVDIGRKAQDVGAVIVPIGNDGDAVARVDRPEIGRMWQVGMSHDHPRVAELAKVVSSFGHRSVQPGLARPKFFGPPLLCPAGDRRRVVHDENVEIVRCAHHGGSHRFDQLRAITFVVDRRQPEFAFAQRSQRDQDGSRTKVTSIRLRKAHGTSLGFATMRSLRQVFRPSTGDAQSASKSVDPELSSPLRRSWNTVSTIGAGSVADIDTRGVVFPRSRPVSVEVWFGSGDRWVQGGADAGVRQSRIVGLPIIETRQRVGDGDVVQTTWADESGDGRGRVIVQLQNETDVAVVAAVVVRPQRILGEPGVITEARIAGNLIVVDRLPVVDLTRAPGDVAVAIDEGSALLDLLRQSNTALVGHDQLTDQDGRVSIAAMIPLTPGVDRQIHVLDGREASSVAAAPLDRVVAGWRSHLDAAMEIDLPRWPKHLPTSLLSSLIGAVADDGSPLGSESWRRHEDALIAVALGGAGVHWAAAAVADRLLADVADGAVARADWPRVAAAMCAIVQSPVGDEVIASHGDTAVSIAGEVLTNAAGTSLDRPLVEVVRIAHGAEAASDASSIAGIGADAETLVELGRLGVGLGSGAKELTAALDASTKPLVLADIALSMVASAQTERTFEAVVPVRALAGSTWSWNDDGCGDSPHARAAIAVGLRSLCVASFDDVIDMLPGMSSSWLGQSVRVSRVQTPAGSLSFALRWHGARPALLWEIVGDPKPGFTLTCSSIDPSFRTTELSGEALLQEPAHLVGT